MNDNQDKLFQEQDLLPEQLAQLALHLRKENSQRTMLTLSIAIIAMVFSLGAIGLILVYCGTKSDLEHLQDQVNGLESKLNRTSADAANALSVANAANDAANRAEAAANQAAQYAQDTNAKLDKLFMKKMRLLDEENAASLSETDRPTEPTASNPWGANQNDAGIE